MDRAESKLCNICGIKPAGSREHLPGVAAANDTEVEITYLNSGKSRSGEVDYWTQKEADGLVVRTICSHCNSRTGGDYGTAYKEFVSQFAQSGRLDEGQPRCWISLTDVQPLRVLKQMTSMFLAAQREVSGAHWAGCRQFVLRKQSKLRSDELRYFLYRNVSSLGRIVPFTGLMSVFRRWPQLLFTELSWPPVGLVFATDAHPLLNGMAEITHWGRDFHFRERASLGFSVPQLRVEAHWPLGFGSAAQAFEWSDRDGVMVLLSPGPQTANEGGQFPVLTRQLPKGRRR